MGPRPDLWALDFLAQHKNEIETELFERCRSVFELQVDMLFWGTTSTYFEGDGPAEFGRFGFSKDSRPDRKQVMIGVVMTRTGLPIAHEVFRGDTSDVLTFKEIIYKVRKRFKLSRVIFVGDRGMVSGPLLNQLDKDGIEYIVGMRMRKSRDVGEVLSTGGRYKVVSENLRVKEVWCDAERYIVCHNPAQAEHDKKAREDMVQRLEKQLQNGGVKSLVGHSGYRCYLLLKKDAVTGINREVLKEEERYDGKFVLRTNSDLDTAEVALAYKDLWRVEHAFRELKSALDLRPIYHWKDSRVNAHIMVCFLALVLESALQRKLLDNGIRVEYSYLIRDLKQLRAVELLLGDELYLCRTELVGDSYQAFKCLGIRPPQQVEKINHQDSSQKEEKRPQYEQLTLF